MSFIPKALQKKPIKYFKHAESAENSAITMEHYGPSTWIYKVLAFHLFLSLRFLKSLLTIHLSTQNAVLMGILIICISSLL